ncbi:MAG TPA: ABC transporter permease [Herpetosiphon sp.]|uniref:Binding-protein-dependent transport systems inner membrane component n=1 Tax=Herpetosiphon aurantiacus (strain ATCC 23779 / DSM 785 / 114-95) TaxID=316274 RepID=A9B400_HERA2|nr:ABC transporter permease [Herpetosiphon sp.]ABX06136.1 binding-protein-dependent transport systems inner membrane component [Herpetosiphon aurantiacus DSM 785]HBW51326.1 ABC transporter permease [Herpetosiphon sp.]
MTVYLIRRLFQAILVLILSSAVIYSLFALAPGGPLEELTQVTDPKNRPSPEDIQRQIKLLGADKPWFLWYPTWLAGDTWMDKIGFEEYQGERKGILRWDWGTSWKFQRNKPVLEIIGDKLPDTLWLMISSTIISLVLGIPLGVFSAVRQYSFFDYVLTTFSFIGLSLPAFWFGLLIIAVSLWFKRNGWFYFPAGDILALRNYEVPILGTVVAGSLLDRVMHLVMPVTVLSMLNLANWSRFMRASMLEVLSQDYVRTARAKGVKERVVIYKHAFRNALIPLITIIVFAIPGVFGGALFTETVFNYKALGFTFISALNLKDYPLAMAFLLISSILLVFATLLADVLYTIVDPRIRLD